MLVNLQICITVHLDCILFRKRCVASNVQFNFHLDLFHINKFHLNKYSNTTQKQYRRDIRFFPEKLFRQARENIFGKFGKKTTLNFIIVC